MLEKYFDLDFMDMVEASAFSVNLLNREFISKQAITPPTFYNVNVQ